MSANPSQDQSPDKKEELSDKTDIQEAKEEQEKNLNQELPELQNFSVIAQGLGELALLWTDKHVKFINSFKVLNDPNYGNNLLKITDPQKLREIGEAHAVTGKEIAKQKERLKGKGEAKVGIGPFKTQRINFETYDRKLQAYRIAYDLQKHINGSELQLKIYGTITNFGLDKDRARQLKIDFAKWYRKNHGSFEEYFRTHQKEIGQLHQQQFKTDKKDPSKEKEAFQRGVTKTKEQFKSTRIEAARAHVKQIQSGQGAIKDLLNPNLPYSQVVLTPQQERERHLAISKGEYVRQTPVIPKTQPIQPVIQPSVAQITPPPSISPPTIPPIQPSLSLGLRQRFLGALSRSVIGQSAKSAVSSITGFLGKKAAISAALKLGISAIAGTATAGITTAAQIGLKLGKALFTAIGEKLPIVGDFIKNIGKAFDLPGKAIKYAALAAVLAIVGIFILILFFTSGLATNMPTLTSADAINVPVKKEEVGAQKWPDFEKAVLGALDTNGHNQVKK